MARAVNDRLIVHGSELLVHLDEVRSSEDERISERFGEVQARHAAVDYHFALVVLSLCVSDAQLHLPSIRAMSLEAIVFLLEK